MISKEQSVPELEPTIYFHYHKQKTMACCLISYSLSKSTDSEGWDEISPEICFDVFSLENCSPGQNAERCQFWGAEGREERAEERKGENPWEHRGQLLDGLGVCGMFVAVSERRLECDCGPWWSHTRGDTKSSSWADCRAVPLIYTLEDLLQGTLQVCYCAAGQPPLRGLQCVLWELMEPSQTRCGQQPWCSSFLPRSKPSVFQHCHINCALKGMLLGVMSSSVCHCTLLF